MYLRMDDLRKEKGLSQKQVAELLGVSCKTYSAYEKGKRKIRVQQLCILADFYHTSVDYLVGYTDEREPHD